MKKVFLVLVAGISLASAKAQIQYGVKAGANFATVTGSDVQGTKTLTAFNGGVFVKLPLVAALSLQPEVLYSGQGTKVSSGGDNATLAMNYINVPVLAKYTFPMGISVLTGPQIGFLMSAKEKADGQSMDVKSDLKSTDFSWDFGASYVTPFNLGIEARYGLGLANVAKSTDGSSSTIKNSVFSVGLLYVINGSKKK